MISSPLLLVVILLLPLIGAADFTGSGDLSVNADVLSDLRSAKYLDDFLKVINTINADFAGNVGDNYGDIGDRRDLKKKRSKASRPPLKKQKKGPSPPPDLSWNQFSQLTFSGGPPPPPPKGKMKSKSKPKSKPKKSKGSKGSKSSKGTGGKKGSPPPNFSCPQPPSSPFNLGPSDFPDAFEPYSGCTVYRPFSELRYLVGNATNATENDGGLIPVEIQGGECFRKLAEEPGIVFPSDKNIALQCMTGNGLPCSIMSEGETSENSYMFTIESPVATVDGWIFHGAKSSGVFFAGTTNVLTAFIGNTFYNNHHHVDHKGSCIHSIYSSTLMVNNIFVDNSAKVGGAVYALRAPSVVAANSFFMNNTATHRGGAIAVKDYDYNNSTLDPLSPSPFPVSIGGSVFVRNTAMFQGGAVYVNNHTSELLVESYFVDNVAKNNATGGAVVLRGHWNGNGSMPDTSYIFGCGFWGNTAIATVVGNQTTGGNGGAVYAHKLSDLEVRGTYFKDNTLESTQPDDETFYSQGGAVFAKGVGTTLFESTIFDGNAAIRGGAIFAMPFTLNNFTDELLVVTLGSAFCGNEAQEQGGAIMCDWGNSLLVGEETDFFSNVADVGSAVVVSGGGDFAAWDTGRMVNNTNPAVLVQKESITSGLLNNW